MDIANLQLNGSLHVIAEQIMGEKDENGILRYSENVGRCQLINVVIQNQGFAPDASLHWWNAEVNRRELCEIIIHGNGEFHAENVTLPGNLHIEVEDGCKLTAFVDRDGLKFKKETLSGPKRSWVYHLSDDGLIILE